MRCVPKSNCNFSGLISSTPVHLTQLQEEWRIPLSVSCEVLVLICYTILCFSPVSISSRRILFMCAVGNNMVKEHYSSALMNEIYMPDPEHFKNMHGKTDCQANSQG